MSKKAIIIGAGPAGLTAAYELLTRTDIVPVILEKTDKIGGISRTTNYKGNRMDMGPHRFFSKSDRVMDWWLRIMPLQEGGDSHTISYQNKTTRVSSKQEPEDPNKVMLVIKRLTRIYFLRKFFAYPLQLTWETLRALGFEKTVLILFSFIWAKLFPRRPEKNLEDFIINRFGKQLYLLFFKDYTEKVWGRAPGQISAEWGAQRIKGVSLSKAIQSALQARRRAKGDTGDFSQKGTETSLIEQFLYPKFGTGSLWEETARQIQEKGGQIYYNQDVRTIVMEGQRIIAVDTTDNATGKANTWEGDYFFSTMPVQELIAGMGESVPPTVREVAAGLQYRDFINVGLLLKRFSSKEGGELQLKDNWIYVQERDVKVGRMMIYNNWGGSMVKDPDTVWIGMEYFCNKTDALWFESDESLRRLAIEELDRMDLARPEDVLDGTVQRMEKTYPAYFGTYDRFDTIRAYTDQFANLFLVGRNGMHKYNNADHSMLCSMVAVDNIIAGIKSKANLWAINTEQEYHEEKSTPNIQPEATPSKKHPFLVDYLWQDQANRRWWLGALALFALEFIFFKLRYPYANYMPDSYSYIEAAATNADVNTWPVAYSKFLRLISVFTHHDTPVIAIQYVFLQLSTLFFLFSLTFLQSPGRRVRNTLLIFAILNPVPLFVANYISADAIFMGLSLCWLSTLLWLIYRPKPWIIVPHAILLLCCCTVRYNALYYPFISLFAFIITRWSWKYKAAGVTLAAVLVISSALFTTDKMESVTGKRQFSAFGGWQLANNALYMYEHIPAGERRPVPQQFSGLEKMVRAHMDTLQKVHFTREDSVNNFFYLWSDRGPLIQYLKLQYVSDSTTPYFKRWASVSPLYLKYALHLIRSYPGAYLANFAWPNSLRLVVPPPEFLGTYNMGKDTVQKLAQDWFNYKTAKIAKHNWAAGSIPATSWYPIFVALANVFFLLALVGVSCLGLFHWNKYGSPQLVIITSILWISNGIFSTIASPIVLRYQLFPTLAIFAVALICFERLFQSETSNIKYA